MVGEDGFGIRVSQVLRFRADSYVVEHELKVENRHTVAQGVELAQVWSAPAEWPKEQEQFAGARPIHVVRLPQGTLWARREYLNKATDYVGEDRWIGFESGIAPVGQNGVYLTALIPREPGDRRIRGAPRDQKRQMNLRCYTLPRSGSGSRCRSSSPGRPGTASSRATWGRWNTSA